MAEVTGSHQPSRAGGAARVQQVGLLQREGFDDLPVAFTEMVVVVVAQLPDGFDPGAQGGLRGRAAPRAVVVGREELAQVPRQRGVDRVLLRAEVRQQADVPWPGRAGRSDRASVLPWSSGRECSPVPHRPEHLHVHRALEEVQQRDDGQLVVREGVAEAVVERRGERLVAALARVDVLDALPRRRGWPGRTPRSAPRPRRPSAHGLAHDDRAASAGCPWQ